MSKGREQGKFMADFIQKYRSDRLFRIRWALAFFIPGVLFSKVLPIFWPQAQSSWDWLSVISFLLAYIVAGLPVVRRAYQQVRQRSWMTEHFLMSIATFGAMYLGAWAEAAAVMLFYEVGEYAQSVALDRSRKSISDLMDLAPDTSLVMRDGDWQEVDSSDVEVGETLLLQAGARVPLDVTVVEGVGEVDTSALTGEALPRQVQAGDVLLSGTLNLQTALTCRVDKSLDDSTLSKIIELSGEASLRKGETERLISRFARYYTPIVVALAVLIFLLPPLFFGGDWMDWFRRSLNLLVISCPCALVLSVPLAYFAGIGLASSRGILIKGGDALENFAHTKTMIFDKTGTLTTGLLEVREIQVLDPDYSQDQVLSLALDLERASSHLIAEALRRAGTASPTAIALDSLTELPGLGVKGADDQHHYYLGNARLMESLGLAAPHTDPAMSAVFLAQEDPDQDQARLLAVFLLADEVKDTAPGVIQQLRKLNIQHLGMMSGDKTSVVEKEAKALGLDSWAGDLLPQDKLAKLEEYLQNKPQGTMVSFVGDGINDTPSLAIADIGIAMADVGSDAAVQAADMVLIRDELEAIPEALAISRKTNRIALQNIGFSLAIKILVVILSLFSIGGMWIAIFADVGVTLLAVANSFRIVVRKNYQKLA